MRLNIKSTNRQLLFCPGPINVASNVKQAVVDNEIGHREEEFSYLLSSINRKLLAFFKVKSGKYHPVVITGSGTAANEAILASVVGNKHILVLVNGEFGQRLFDISSIHNPNTYKLAFGWGEKIILRKLESYLKNNPVDIIAVVHHETSTGMLNPIEKIGNLAKKYHKKFIIDTVSSAGTSIIDLEKCNVSFASGSASKALGSLPGLSFVVGRKDEFEKLKDQPIRVAYLNLYKFYYYSTHFLQTPNTPAVQLFFALDQALTNILSIGVEKRVKKAKKVALFMRKRMRQLGLKFLLSENEMCNFLTTVYLPKYIQMAELKRKMKEKNIVIYEGKGPLKDKVFQVGHVGELSKRDVLFFLECLEAALKESRYETKLSRRFLNRNVHIASKFLTFSLQLLHSERKVH